MVQSLELDQLLGAWRAGNNRSLHQLAPLIYSELHKIAQSCLHQERSDHTLQATALVHELFLRLLKQRRLSCDSRADFLQLAAYLMRLILMDHARSRRAAKRGGAMQKVSLEAVTELSAEVQDLELLALSEALERLRELDTRQHHIVELYYFVGFTRLEIAEFLSISQATVSRQLSSARAFLVLEIGGIVR